MAEANITLSAKQIEATIAALNLADEDNISGQRERDEVRVKLDQAIAEADDNDENNVHLAPNPVSAKGQA